MKTNRLFLPTGNQTRLILAAAFCGALTFAACERKSTGSTGVETPTPATPVVQTAPPEQAVAQPAPPADQIVQPVPSVEPVAITETFETDRLGVAIDAYEKAPTAENQSSVNLAFAKLDVEIAKLEDRVVKTDGAGRAEATSKLNNMQNYRKDEVLRFTKDQNGQTQNANPPVDSRSGTQKVKDTAVMVGDKVENGAKDVGSTLKNAAKDTGEAIKDVVH